jgi:hypothetical protein
MGDIPKSEIGKVIAVADRRNFDDPENRMCFNDGD